MIEFWRSIIAAQLEAALAMMRHCVEVCPSERWEDKIANHTFRQVAYHALFFTDCYLSANEQAFQLRDLHRWGGDEREPVVCTGLSQEQTLVYVALCRQQISASLASETRESLLGPSGFSRRCISRGELHLYNIRHLQHHTGQLSAYLRRVNRSFDDPGKLPWIGSGWK